MDAVIANTENYQREMKKKDKEFLRKRFAESNFVVFDNANEAYRVHGLLDGAGVKHALGEYLRNIEGELCYRPGIEIAEVDKFKSLVEGNEKQER